MKGNERQSGTDLESSLLGYALLYARAGFRVFPAAGIKSHIVTQWEGEGDERRMTGTARVLGCTCPRGASCDAAGKHPVLKSWQERATRDESRLIEWLDPMRGKFASSNLAIATGEGSGVWVLDVDAKGGGPAVLEALEANHGDLPDTLTQASGGGGRHYFFRHPGWKVTNAVSLFAGIDLRGEGGQVVVEPSRHASGGVYAWIDGDPSEVRPVDAPEWLLDFVRKASGRHDAGKSGPRFSVPEGIDSGSRNATLFRLGAGLRHYGFGAVELEAALRTANARCKPPLSDEEVLRIVQSVQRYRRGSSDTPMVANFDVDFEIDGEGKRKPRYYRVAPRKIVSQVIEASGGWPKRLGSQLFLEDGDAPEISFVRTDDDLFGYLQEKADLRWRRGADAEGVSFVSRKELHSILSRRAEVVDDISVVPLEPPPPRVYVSARIRPAGPGDGSHLRAYLGLFSPATPLDAALLQALALTPFWGGRPGGRPLVLVTGRDGVGVQSIGKTSAVTHVTAPAGGPFCVEIDTPGYRDAIAKQVLSDEALNSRVVLIDNLDGYTRSRELAAAITQPVIDGRPSHGKQRRRINYLTWAATGVTPELDGDLASRTYVLQLDAPEMDSGWEAAVSGFLREHRERIVGDIIALLRGRKSEIREPQGRFPEWESQVLATHPCVNEVIRTRRDRIDEVDADLESLELFLRQLRDDALKTARREYRPKDLTEVWNDANNAHLKPAWLGRILRAHRAKGQLPEGIHPSSERKHGACWHVEPARIATDDASWEAASSREADFDFPTPI